MGASGGPEKVHQVCGIQGRDKRVGVEGGGVKQKLKRDTWTGKGKRNS